MKANELMIGDWVFVNGTPRKVCAITKKKIGYHREDSLDCTRMHYAVLQEVTPIHIYPEILERNGFEKEYVSTICNEFTFIVGCCDMMIRDTNNNLYMEISMFRGVKITYPNIHYVHELQHALRICGLNELADNFRIKEE